MFTRAKKTQFKYFEQTKLGMSSYKQYLLVERVLKISGKVYMRMLYKSVRQDVEILESVSLKLCCDKTHSQFYTPFVLMFTLKL